MAATLGLAQRRSELNRAADVDGKAHGSYMSLHQMPPPPYRVRTTGDLALGVHSALPQAHPGSQSNLTMFVDTPTAPPTPEQSPLG